MTKYLSNDPRESFFPSRFIFILHLQFPSSVQFSFLILLTFNTSVESLRSFKFRQVISSLVEIICSPFTTNLPH